MRGLLYNTFIQNKKAYILSAVVCGIFSLLGALLLKGDEPDSILFQLGGALILVAPMCIVVIAIASIERKTERMLKCNFVKYTLTSGVSHFKYVLTDFAENIATTAYGYGLCVIFYVVIKQVCPEVIYDRIFIETLFYVLLGGSGVAIINSLVYFLKNAEIAELIVGIVFFTIVGLFFLIKIDEGGLRIELTNTVILAGAGIAAVLYLIAGIVEYIKLKKDCT